MFFFPQASAYYKVHVEDYNRKVKKFNAEKKSAAAQAQADAAAAAHSSAAAAAAPSRAVEPPRRRPTLSNWPRQICEKTWNDLKCQAKGGNSLSVAWGREHWVQKKPPTRP